MVFGACRRYECKDLLIFLSTRYCLFGPSRYYCPTQDGVEYSTWVPQAAAQGSCRSTTRSAMAETPLPSNFKILMYGNSHLRQVMHTYNLFLPLGMKASYGAALSSGVKHRSRAYISYFPPAQYLIMLSPRLIVCTYTRCHQNRGHLPSFADACFVAFVRVYLSGCRGHDVHGPILEYALAAFDRVYIHTMPPKPRAFAFVR